MNTPSNRPGAEPPHTERVYPARVPVLRHFVYLWRRLRSWLSRRQWSVRLLNMPICRGQSEEPGLIILQIDGLSRHELNRALDSRRLPFVRKLTEREGYEIRTMYSGLPSTTPAVLGELYYGVSQAVPAFGFCDHRTGQVVQMFQPGIASTVQNELRQRGEGLLRDGSAYCVIFSGESAESSFCPATTGWRSLENAALWRQAALFLMNFMSLLRIAALSVYELTVAVADCARGVSRGFEFWREVAFVPRRVAVNVVLQELTAISAEVDATRGLPVIHANFLGYDENAHRRGPDSAFAHFALSGIDRAIRRIWNAAHGSKRRNYHFWLISDHGQEKTLAYPHLYGCTIQQAVEAIFANETDGSNASAIGKTAVGNEGNQLLRSHWLRHAQREAEQDTTERQRSTKPQTVAIGPLGFVYWPETPLDEDFDPLARKLVEQAHVPIVMARVGEQVLAWNRRGRFRLPEDFAEIISPDHPFSELAANDLVKLCLHSDAGTFVISGWREDEPPISFIPENGAHGGPGTRETAGFVLLPSDAPVPEDRVDIRPSVLRNMALETLGRDEGVRCPRPRAKRDTLRVATYNVHSCIGIDGRLSPARIARVLALADADIIALQELDVRRSRTGFVDQAKAIAAHLQMQLRFHPSIHVKEERFGNAILSPFDLRFVRAARLPEFGRGCEPRSVLWVEVDMHGCPVQVIATHFGLSAAERQDQADALLGPEWLGHPDCRGPVIVCGDFNAMPGSRAYQTLAEQLRDVQTGNHRYRPRRTWLSSFPLTRVDHIFVNDRWNVQRVQVPRTRLARLASDHLPVIVDLELLREKTLLNAGGIGAK